MSIHLIERKNRVSELLFEIEAVHCNLDEPYIFTSGWASPVYVDCRKIISSPRQRREIMQIAAEEIDTNIGRDAFDTIAGGETAGIPFAAWLSDYYYEPMIYVRKEKKGFGRKSQIEGDLEEGQKVLLVEDLATDGKSKVNFCNAIREAGAIVDHCIVVFFYGVFPTAEKIISDAQITLHGLADWRSNLEVGTAKGYFNAEQSAEIKKFLDEPEVWSKAHGGV
ncbi:MAG: orotate phosphoribosyltransferase [Nitrospinaceae bacterium]|mgnify:FL=1|jgi:orotate phosphoribosyltransferase|nr:orotate phosphoribosyltransferase [Nitrospinaceae bacterium]MBT3434856.1 orotate phosphoribosyltransferase [Nitrospinaceae bacterium]MBT4430376.1 orotate phosphoribosyltransferase [Nitrospinaceae bacterium]MBT5368958.1 orotate phosphoribosyltransferase [Nitrospinaceae bacterium]MBT5948709.1 orotate phosphoribosyltransferase [Nitrospinaceae bacterium]